VQREVKRRKKHAAFKSWKKKKKRTYAKSLAREAHFSVHAYLPNKPPRHALPVAFDLLSTADLAKKQTTLA
jgi:hypothetical protein